MDVLSAAIVATRMLIMSIPVSPSVSKSSIVVWSRPRMVHLLTWCFVSGISATKIDPFWSLFVPSCVQSSLADSVYLSKSPPPLLLILFLFTLISDIRYFHCDAHQFNKDFLWHIMKRNELENSMTNDKVNPSGARGRQWYFFLMS